LVLSVKPYAKYPVHDLLKGLAGFSRFRLELGSNIVVKRQGCSHIVMLN